MINAGTAIEQQGEKPLKRFCLRSVVCTRLKPGVNENWKCATNKWRAIRILSLTPCFSGVLVMGGRRKTVLTVFRVVERQWK
jgi:hypothetical protein